jgi:putative transposase
VWEGRFKSPVIQNDEHLLTVLRSIEANPLRPRLVRRADEYPSRSYGAHGLGEASLLIDPLARIIHGSHSSAQCAHHQPAA